MSLFSDGYARFSSSRHVFLLLKAVWMVSYSTDSMNHNLKALYELAFDYFSNFILPLSLLLFFSNVSTQSLHHTQLPPAFRPIHILSLIPKHSFLYPAFRSLLKGNSSSFLCLQ